MRRGVSLVATLAAGAMVLTLTPTAAADDEEAPPALGTRSDLDVADLDRESRTPADEDAPAMATAASTPDFLSDQFHDYCDDSLWEGLDLHRANILDARHRTGQLGVRYTACDDLDAAALQGGIVMKLRTPDGDEHEYEYLIDVYAHDLDEVRGDIVWLEEPEVAVHRGQAEIDGDAVTFLFPAEAIFPPGTEEEEQRFDFEIEALHPDLGDDPVVDRMPEAAEDPGSWPDDSCVVRPESRTKTVTAADGQMDTAVAAARAAGLHPTRPTSGGQFTVRLRDAADHDRLAALDGVERVADAVVYEPMATEVELAGSDPWWRGQVYLGAADGVADGTGVTVAVIDDGVDGTREEFGDRVARGYDTVADRELEAGGNWARGGHGNHVAGLLAADSEELLGAAPGVTVRPYQAFDFGGCASEASVAAAIEAAVDDEVDVINLSLGSPQGSSLVRSTISRADDAGILVVAASGNFGRETPRGGSPNDHPAVVSVGATDHRGEMTAYTSHGGWLDLLAPGGDPDGVLLRSLAERDGYFDDAGTSMAAPIVAGAAALYLETGGQDVAGALRATASSLLSGTYPELRVGRLLGLEVLRIVDTTAACGDAPSGTFPDVPSGHAHAPGIDCTAFWEVAGGFGDGTYRPQTDVTRAQMATFIVRLIEQVGGELPGPGLVTFPDVQGNTHQEAIESLAAAGIVTGHADQTYRPQASVTRAQMATFLVRAIEYRTDVSIVPVGEFFADHHQSVHKPAIEKVATVGVTGGDGGGRYRPNDATNRGQMGSFLARTIAHLVDDA